MTTNIRAHFDGACEPTNPGGNMGIGAIAVMEGKELFAHSNFVPASNKNSNNVAEYMALKELLKFLISHLNANSVSRLDIRGDSMLVVNQMNGKWKIKKGLYVPHAKEVKELFAELIQICTIKRTPLTLQWIPREQNDVADVLSKKGMIENKVEFRLQKQ